jgi:hypothetical protein
MRQAGRHSSRRLVSLAVIAAVCCIGRAAAAGDGVAIMSPTTDGGGWCVRQASNE